MLIVHDLLTIFQKKSNNMIRQHLFLKIPQTMYKTNPSLNTLMLPFMNHERISKYHTLNYKKCANLLARKSANCTLQIMSSRQVQSDSTYYLINPVKWALNELKFLQGWYLDQALQIPSCFKQFSHIKSEPKTPYFDCILTYFYL